MTELTLEERKIQRLSQFKNSFDKMVATDEAATKKSDAKFIKKSARTYTKDEIINIVSRGDPI